VAFFVLGFGQLKGKAGDNYHKTWAMYFAKFIKAYEDNGIKLWGVTVQNEPSDGFLPGSVNIV
jgi:glucosylceramidase